MTEKARSILWQEQAMQRDEKLVFVQTGSDAHFFAFVCCEISI